MEKKKYTLLVRRTFIKEITFESELEEKELNDIVNSLDDLLKIENINILEEEDFKDEMFPDDIYLYDKDDNEIFSEKESDYR